MNELLDKIIEYAKANAQFSAPAAQGELHLTYRQLTEALNTLRNKGIVKFIGGMCYEYVADLKNEGCHSEKHSEDMDDWAKQRAYIEMRRQELIRRMQSEFEEDDDDDDDDGGIFAADENFVTDISDKLLNKIKNTVKGELFEIYRDIFSVTICAKGLTFGNGLKAEFTICHSGKTTELCDGGIANRFLQCKPGYGYKRTKNTLAKITEGLMIRMDDDNQLFVDVSDLPKLPAMYYYFYWLIESLIT